GGSDGNTIPGCDASIVGADGAAAGMAGGDVRTDGGVELFAGGTTGVGDDGVPVTGGIGDDPSADGMPVRVCAGFALAGGAVPFARAEPSAAIGTPGAPSEPAGVAAGLVVGGIVTGLSAVIFGSGDISADARGGDVGDLGAGSVVGSFAANSAGDFAGSSAAGGIPSTVCAAGLSAFACFNACGDSGAGG